MRGCLFVSIPNPDGSVKDRPGRGVERGRSLTGHKREGILSLVIPRSSNGRTTASGAVYLGSNPSLGTILDKTGFRALFSSSWSGIF